MPVKECDFMAYSLEDISKISSFFMDYHNCLVDMVYRIRNSNDYYPDSEMLGLPLADDTRSLVSLAALVNICNCLGIELDKGNEVRYNSYINGCVTYDCFEKICKQTDWVVSEYSSVEDMWWSVVIALGTFHEENLLYNIDIEVFNDVAGTDYGSIDEVCELIEDNKLDAMELAYKICCDNLSSQSATFFLQVVKDYGTSIDEGRLIEFDLEFSGNIPNALKQLLADISICHSLEQSVSFEDGVHLVFLETLAYGDGWENDEYDFTYNYSFLIGLLLLDDYVKNCVKGASNE